jgi:hypothetical protein
MLLSLDTELHSLLMELNKETGMPVTSFVVEILETTKPQIRNAIEMIKKRPTNGRCPIDNTPISRPSQLKGGSADVSNLSENIPFVNRIREKTPQRGTSRKG